MSAKRMTVSSLEGQSKGNFFHYSLFLTVGGVRGVYSPRWNCGGRPKASEVSKSANKTVRHLIIYTFFTFY